MSNKKRIDLTQFNSEKEWDLTGFDWLAKQADSEYVANAVRWTPDLIAELKRCYEELDKWTNYATYIENVDMDCHKDASAEAGFLWKCTDCGAHFELPENGIYECEFGCDASEWGN